VGLNVDAEIAVEKDKGECEELSKESSKVAVRNVKDKCCDQTAVSVSEGVSGGTGINSALGTLRNKLELKMLKKVMVNRKPTTAKELLETGILDGVTVAT